MRHLARLALAVAAIGSGVAGASIQAAAAPVASVSVVDLSGTWHLRSSTCRDVAGAYRITQSGTLITAHSQKYLHLRGHVRGTAIHFYISNSLISEDSCGFSGTVNGAATRVTGHDNDGLGDKGPFTMVRVT